MLKLKTKSKVAIAGVVIGVVALGTVAGITIGELVNESKELRTRIERTEDSIVELEEEKQGLVEENQVLVNEKEELKKEIENLKGEYDALMGKYKKEIQPVSFNSSNLLVESNGSVAKFEKALKGTGLEGLGYAYHNAELQYGVNGVFLMALTAEESGWGNSHRARTQNNLSGFAVYSSASKGKTFSSKEESIMATAKLLKEKYLTTGAEHHNGMSASSVNIKYCPNDGGNWSRNITTIANGLVSKINSR